MSDDVVQEVKDRADIVSTVSRYLTLKKQGKNFVGLCPFHSEKTPSFTVSPEKDLFHCFGCGKGGDVLGFIMEIEGVDFPEALKMLAGQVGVRIPERSRPRGHPSPYADLYAANRLAMECYHRILLDDKMGGAAREYLKERGIDRETIDAFSLGYAPDEWDLLLKHARSENFSTDVLVRCGLLAEAKSGFYDYFRRRILFPIKDHRGRVSGFAGREFGGGAPKYLNSPDTAIFSKRKILFGYHAARGKIRLTGEVLIVEGYTDLIRLFHEGVTNVVAPMGTALTEDQAALLSRAAKTAILIYDRDEAGLRATFRTGDIFLKHGMGVKAALLPEGEDPDSYVRGNGMERFRELLEGAEDVFDLKIRILEERGLLSSVSGKRTSAEHLLSTIKNVKDDLIRDIYLAKASECLGVDKHVLEHRMKGGRDVSLRRSHKNGKGREKLGLHGFEGTMERYLIHLMLMGGEFLSRILECLSPEDFLNPLYKKAYSELSELFKGSGALPPDRVINEVSEDLQPLISGLCLASDEVTDPERILQDCLRGVEARRVKDEMDHIKEGLGSLDGGDDELVRRFYRLKKRLISLQSDSISLDQGG
jgi:DNA primase